MLQRAEGGSVDGSGDIGPTHDITRFSGRHSDVFRRAFSRRRSSKSPWFSLRFFLLGKFVHPRIAAMVLNLGLIFLDLLLHLARGAIKRRGVLVSFVDSDEIVLVLGIQQNFDANPPRHVLGLENHRHTNGRDALQVSQEFLGFREMVSRTSSEIDP